MNDRIEAEDKAGYLNNLYEAIWRADVDAVKKIVRKGADINGRFANGRTPLTAAIFYYKRLERQRLTIVKNLLSHKRIDVNAIDGDGDTPLATLVKYASFCSTADSSLMRALLQKGAQQEDQKILKSACHSGKNVTVRLLLEYGADPSMLEVSGSYKRFIAHLIEESENYCDIARLLIEARMPKYSILRACYKGDLARIKSMLRWMAPEDINYQYAGDRTLLMVAAENGYPEIVRELLKYNADHLVLNKCQSTAWMLACAHSKKLTPQQVGCQKSAALLERYARAYVGCVLSSNRKSAKKHAYKPLPFLPKDVQAIIGLYTICL